MATHFLELCSMFDKVVLLDVSHSYVWDLKIDDYFSVSSTRILLDSTLLGSDHCHTIWNNLIPKKVNVFL